MNLLYPRIELDRLIYQHNVPTDISFLAQVQTLISKHKCNYDYIVHLYNSAERFNNKIDWLKLLLGSSLCESLVTILSRSYIRKGFIVMVNKLEKYNIDYLNELFCSYYILVYNKLPNRESLPKHLLIKRIKRMLKVKIDYENRGIL